MLQEIRFRNLEKPREKKLRTDIKWVCNSFGFVAGRDIECVSEKIVEDLLLHYPRNGPILSEGLANDLDISLARVNHHLRNLMEAGLLYRHKRFIVLRGGSLKSAVEEIRKDVNRILDDLTVVAEDVDKRLGMKNRA